MDLINEINVKYSLLEAEVDKKLAILQCKQLKLDQNPINNNDLRIKQNTTRQLSYEEALARNNSLLKSLEMTKARLRSRSTFSPIEQILQKALENYKKDFID